MSTESEFRILSFKSTTLFSKHNQGGLCTAMWPRQLYSCCPEMHRGKGVREAQTQSRWICNAPAQRINVVHGMVFAGRRRDHQIVSLSIHPSRCMTTTPYVARRSETTEFTGHNHPYLDSRKLGQLMVKFIVILFYLDGVVRTPEYAVVHLAQGRTGCLDRQAVLCVFGGQNCPNQIPQEAR